MDFKKISDLTEILTLLDDDVFAVDRSGALRKVTNANLRAAIIDQVLAALPDEDINWTGDNTHAGDEEFNGDVEFTGDVDLSEASVTLRSIDSLAVNNYSLIGTLAHGESYTPVIIAVTLVCVTAELNFVAGEEVTIAYGYASRWVGVTPDATNFTIAVRNAPAMFDKSTGNWSSITNANWIFRIRYIKE